MQKLVTQALPILNRSWAKVLLIFLIWTFLALFFFAQDYFFSYATDRSFNIWTNLSLQLSNFYTWAILVPLIMFLAKNFRIERKNWLRNLTVHLSAGIIIALFHRYFSIVAYLFITSNEVLKDGFPKFLNLKIIGGSFNSFIIYWLILGIYYSFDYYQQYREHRLLTAQLQGQLAQTQLQSLKMQLQPHFLFNTLHAISALMDEDVKAARRMLARLSDLLRQTLDNIGVQEVPLKQEIEFLKSYLEIQQARFHDRLSVKFEIKADTLDALVPNLILQPLVENAIKHGILPRAKGGYVQISSRRKDDSLILAVRDNGVGVTNCGIDKIKDGFGITNTRKRLQCLYGLGHSLDIKDNKDSGLDVCLTFPFKNSSKELAENEQD